MPRRRGRWVPSWVWFGDYPELDYGAVSEHRFLLPAVGVFEHGRTAKTSRSATTSRRGGGLPSSPIERPREFMAGTASCLLRHVLYQHASSDADGPNGIWGLCGKGIPAILSVGNSHAVIGYQSAAPPPDQVDSHSGKERPRTCRRRQRRLISWQATSGHLSNARTENQTRQTGQRRLRQRLPLQPWQRSRSRLTLFLRTSSRQGAIAEVLKGETCPRNHQNRSGTIFQRSNFKCS